MRTINGIKKNIAHCYEIDTGERTAVYWSNKDFAFAEYLCTLGGLGIIENLGYVYKFNDLKKTLEKLGNKRIENFYKRFEKAKRNLLKSN